MAEKRKILTCKRYGAALSQPVTIRREGDKNVAKPEFIDERHVMDCGFAYESFKPYRTSAPEKAPLEFAPQIWMTARDLLETVEYTKIASRLNGCCGLDGCDGPNRVCICGAEVGTEMSDCWTSYLFIPNPEGTRWKAE